MPRPSKIAVTLALAAGGIAAYWALTDDGMRPLSEIGAVTDSPARVMPPERGSVLPEAPSTPRAAMPVERPPSPSTTSQRASGDAPARQNLVRDVRRHLARVGCLAGPPSDTWDEAATAAARAFGEHINATIPVNTADHVLLTLLEGYRGLACNLVCPQGERADGDGICRPAVDAAAQPPVQPANKAAPELPVISAAPASPPSNVEPPERKTEPADVTQASPPQPIIASAAKPAATLPAKPIVPPPAIQASSMPAKPATTTPLRTPTDRVARTVPHKPAATRAEASSRKPREADRVASSRYPLQPSPIARPALLTNY